MSGPELDGSGPEVGRSGSAARTQLSRLGAALGNWNDSRVGARGYNNIASAPWPMRAIEAVAARLYGLGAQQRDEAHGAVVRAWSAPLDLVDDLPSSPPRLTAEQTAHVIDCLRRSTELLMHPMPPNTGSQLAPGWFDLRDHQIAVALRVIREYDPEHMTDMAVGS